MECEKGGTNNCTYGLKIKRIKNVIPANAITIQQAIKRQWMKSLITDVPCRKENETRHLNTSFSTDQLQLTAFVILTYRDG